MARRPFRPYDPELLEQDIRAQIRNLYRLREIAQEHGVWSGIEGACSQLSQTANDLKRKGNRSCSSCLDSSPGRR